MTSVVRLDGLLLRRERSKDSFSSVSSFLSDRAFVKVEDEKDLSVSNKSSISVSQLKNVVFICVNEVSTFPPSNKNA